MMNSMKILFLFLVACTSSTSTRRDVETEFAGAYCERLVACQGGSADACTRALVAQYCLHTPCEDTVDAAPLELCLDDVDRMTCSSYLYPESCETW